jgi:AcrR family transcriptional regulator
MTKRIRLSPDERREQLITLGAKMLGERAIEDISVSEIAAQAGISRGLLFHYFPSKQHFHVEVARAAAAEMIRRTEPDTTQSPVEALRGALSSFMDYVEENPDNYKSLVRGAASGDAEMRAIFDETRSTMAQRILDVLSTMGLEVSARMQLAIAGWVAYVEECVVRWIDTRTVSREQLLEMLTKSLSAVALSATDEEVGTLVSIVTAESAIGAG